MTHTLPSAFEALHGVGLASRLAVFLDYDGTLSAIAGRPEAAYMDGRMREAVERLAMHAQVGVVSGRALDDVRGRVGLSGLFYAGSHGFEVEYPDGGRDVLGGGGQYLAALEAAAYDLAGHFEATPGVLVESKPFAVAVHFRQVPSELRPAVEELVLERSARYPELRLSGGKLVLELRPNVAWHKGSVVEVFLRDLDRRGGPRTAVYAGDDVTDEDAFEAVARHSGGISVVVGDRAREATLARYCLPDVETVRRWLQALTGRLDGTGAGAPGTEAVAWSMGGIATPSGDGHTRMRRGAP